MPRPARISEPPWSLRDEIHHCLVDGDRATSELARLELLYSARNPQEFAEIREELAALTD